MGRHQHVYGTPALFSQPQRTTVDSSLDLERRALFSILYNAISLLNSCGSRDIVKEVSFDEYSIRVMKSTTRQESETELLVEVAVVSGQYS